VGLDVIIHSSQVMAAHWSVCPQTQGEAGIPPALTGSHQVLHKSKREYGSRVRSSGFANHGARVGEPRERLFYRGTTALGTRWPIGDGPANVAVV